MKFVLVTNIKKSATVTFLLNRIEYEIYHTELLVWVKHEKKLHDLGG